MIIVNKLGNRFGIDASLLMQTAVEFLSKPDDVREADIAGLSKFGTTATRWQRVHDLIVKYKGAAEQRGVGAYSHCFSFTPGLVFKTNIVTGLQDDAQVEWLEYCAKNQENINLPRIQFLWVYREPESNRNCFAVVSEELYRIAWPVTSLFSDWLGNFFKGHSESVKCSLNPRTLPQIEKCIETQTQMVESIGEVESVEDLRRLNMEKYELTAQLALKRAVTRDHDGDLDSLKFVRSSIYQLIDSLNWERQGTRVRLDLHSGNVMIRGNGDLVITDPLA